MAQLDVSGTLLDPDFLDPVILVHRKPFVDIYGENQLSENGFNTFGCVQPASGKTLLRLPEALRVANVNSFWIQGVITSDGSCQYPDIIIYKGSRYAVQTVLDYTNFGAGFCEGSCIRQVPTL